MKPKILHPKAKDRILFIIVSTSLNSKVIINTHNVPEDHQTVIQEKSKKVCTDSEDVVVTPEEVSKEMLGMEINFNDLMKMIGAVAVEKFIVYEGSFRSNMRKLRSLKHEDKLRPNKITESSSK